jgi:hypothetical protein
MTLHHRFALDDYFGEDVALAAGFSERPLSGPASDIGN